ncbi:sugar-binding protein [Tunicatimonas pelagia]|uniref:sugar-binding protein n=1 Tax=Tunicatimonas pelagia TaxID=931531 RepID=UPI002664FBCA|nr:sugar-binding protein [Tunicatimonas pelagia]WKN46217.1 metallophosphoesterase [Tunicatimonas pelagia]
MKTYTMRTFTYLTVLFWVVALSIAQAQENNSPKIVIESIEGAKPFTSLEVNNGAKNFQFAIVSDRTGGHRPGIFLDGVRKLNLLQPEFVMSVGDLIEGYTTDKAEIDRQWTEFNGFIDELTVPFFYVPGNHDYTNEVLAEEWQERFGKDYYHFQYNDVLFLCLNSEDNARGAGRGTIDDEQYEYIKQTLEENADVKWTLVFMHQPLWDQEEDPKRWADVETLLADREHSVFVGHRHRYVKYERNNGNYYILATTGGGSPLRGPELGEFDHVAWITMTNEGPIIANLALDGIWSDEVFTEETAQLMQPLLQSQAISIEPLLVQDNTFEAYETELKLTNNSDVPMQIDLTVQANPKLITSFGALSREISPNSVEVVKLGLQATEPVALDSISPLVLNSTIAYQSEDMPEVSFESTYRLRPEKVAVISPTESVVQLDGSLDEWSEFTYSVGENGYVDSDPFSHQGEGDASFQFDVTYDDEYLYVAAAVTDDQLETTPGKNPFDQDGISLLIDARSENISALETGEQIFREVLYLGISPLEEADSSKLFLADRLPEGTQATAKRTDEGYVAEFTVPVSYLNELQSGNWESLRVNVGVRDFDNDGQHQTTLFWKPDWRGKENYVGSGTFRKSVDVAATSEEEDQ